MSVVEIDLDENDLLADAPGAAVPKGRAVVIDSETDGDAEMDSIGAESQTTNAAVAAAAAAGRQKPPEEVPLYVLTLPLLVYLLNSFLCSSALVWRCCFLCSYCCSALYPLRCCFLCSFAVVCIFPCTRVVTKATGYVLRQRSRVVRVQYARRTYHPSHK
jgi:hypothetical protein